MYNKTLTNTLLAMLLIALPVAQAQDDAAPDPPASQPADDDPAVLTPLAIGNTWVYENKTDDVLSTERIDGVVLFDNQRWYLMRATESPIDPAEQADEDADEDALVTEVWLANLDGVESDGFVEIDPDTDTLKITNITRYFRAEAKVGDKYQPSNNDPGLSIEVLAVDQPVKTQAGEFKCIAYKETHTDEPGYSLTSHVAPGVGIVRYTSEFNGESSSTDLIRFTTGEAN